MQAKHSTRGLLQVEHKKLYLKPDFVRLKVQKLMLRMCTLGDSGKQLRARALIDEHKVSQTKPLLKWRNGLSNNNRRR